MGILLPKLNHKITTEKSINDVYAILKEKVDEGIYVSANGKDFTGTVKKNRFKIKPSRQHNPYTPSILGSVSDKSNGCEIDIDFVPNPLGSFFTVVTTLAMLAITVLVNILSILENGRLDFPAVAIALLFVAVAQVLHRSVFYSIAKDCLDKLTKLVS